MTRIPDGDILRHYYADERVSHEDNSWTAYRRGFLRALMAQLPEGMQHCTIRLIECPKGHGRLIADNWVDSGCPWCTIEALKDVGARLVAEFEEDVDMAVSPATIDELRALLTPPPTSAALSSAVRRR